MSNKQLDKDKDIAWMRRALALAERGIGLCSPNPLVGAVIADQNGEVVGEGFHTYEGVKHAEILALEEAGDRARGATVYVTLEPCSHQGRTGPCADALIAAGVGRVVAAMLDPNPLVAGQGLERLREAGIAVSVGTVEREARRLNEDFAAFIRRKTPLVTLKSAMTLDGKIALAASRSESERQWITGEAARASVQELRHRSDAILVGAGTVAQDNPLLTDRSGKPRRRPLLRVMLDSGLSIPLESQLVQTAQDDVLVFAARADARKQAALQEAGVAVEIVREVTPGKLHWTEILKILGEKKIMSLLVEGGSRINASVLAAGIVDKVHLFYAPAISGAPDAVPFSSNIPGETNREIFVRQTSIRRFGEDFAIEGYIRDPYVD